MKQETPQDENSHSIHVSPDDEAEMQESLIDTEDQQRKQDENKNRVFEKPKLPSKDQFLWLISLAKNELWLIVIGTIGLVLTSGINLLIPQYIGQLIDTVTNSSDAKLALSTLVLSFFGLMLLFAIFTFIRAFSYTLAGERVVARLRRNLFDNIVVQEIGFFDETKTGELINRLSSDTKALENAVTVNISMALRNVIQALGGLFILFYISWKLSLVMIATIPPLSIGAVIYGRFVKSLSKKVQDALAKSSDVAEESFSNIRTVRSFGQESKHKKLYSDAIEESYQLAKKLALAGGTFQGGVMFVANSALVGVLWYGGTLVLNKEMTIGTLTSFLLYTIFVGVALGILSTLYFDIVKALGATERVHALIQRIPKIICDSSVGERLDSSSMQGFVEFKNVNFAYPARRDNQVLHDFSLSLEPGQVVALVGQSGGGKSTVASLLQRYYDPDSGFISVDNVNISDLDVIWLRHKIGAVSQEPVLFATSIRENISYGREDATEEEIIQAAKEANAHQFISQFKEGYDTKVGERGVRLSGGQKQRVAIARALLKNPKILILDEATSALDADSEHLVQQALEKLMKGRTVLVIAHRLSTVKNADKVCVVHQGRIVETGRHQELLQRGGMYKKLVERQLFQSNEDAEEFRNVVNVQ
jgi:ATP-binding cassette subfamily B protein